MKINANKSKSTVFEKNESTIDCDVYTGDERIEQVKEFAYLDSDNKYNKGIKRKISPAYPEQPAPVSDPEMAVEINPTREPTKRSTATNPSKESDSEQSDDSSITSQWGVVEKPDKSTANEAANNKKKKSDEADDTISTTPSTPRGPKPSTVFVQNKDRWTETKTVVDFKNLQNLLVTQSYAHYTYGLKEDREIKAVLREVPKEISIEDVEKNLRAKNIPVQAVYCIFNRSRELLDLVLVTGTAKANDREKETAFFKIKSVCSFPKLKAEQPYKLRELSRQYHNCQSYRHSSKHCFNSARCVKCLENHGPAQYMRCPRAPKRAPAPAKTAPRLTPALAISVILSYARAAAGPRSAPPTAKQTQSSTTDNLNSPCR
ncbi:hypothetical protein EVAR_28389_1 [Eumeta japonica]|uniref:Nucleic-acid-binding protein from transposon X-element n=1 Tax=Eumeta variegata TaxID=151549 RepID=A0A4C1XDK4_EUMVA|nr:hypothetical protein EVAR_28389_1 [Eumeta japonica]